MGPRKIKEETFIEFSRTLTARQTGATEKLERDKSMGRFRPLSHNAPIQGPRHLSNHIKDIAAQWHDPFVPAIRKQIGGNGVCREGGGKSSKGSRCQLDSARRNGTSPPSREHTHQA